MIGRKIDLLEVVTEILNGISETELRHVFRGWIQRVETVIDAGGGYLTS
jgi:hypothetical protein